MKVIFHEITMALRKTKRSKKRFKAGLPWTKAEVAHLISLYPKNSNRDLAAGFGRPEWGIIGKARELALKKDYTDGYRRRQSLDVVPWSTTEINMLRKLYPTTPNEEIAEKIGRTLDAIHMKARRLGLRKMEFWAKEEDELLKKLYQRLRYDHLAELLGRTTSSIMTRTNTLGLERKVGNWTEDETNFLKNSYSEMDFCVIAKKLGRTEATVAQKASRIGLIQNHYWSERDNQRLKELYPKFTARQLAERLDHSFNSVRNKIKQLRLCKKIRGVKKDKHLTFEFSEDDRSRVLEYRIAAVNKFGKSESHMTRMVAI